MQIRGIISALSRRITHIYLVRVPHWHELEKLSKEDKIEVIALLYMSITNAEEIKAPADKNNGNDRTLLWLEPLDKFCHTWQF